MVIELGGSVFEFAHDLVGDLFRAKNAGVTCRFHLNIHGGRVFRRRQRCSGGGQRRRL
jgi:hypothetical protein